MKRTVVELHCFALATALILGACSTGRPYQPQKDGGPDSESSGSGGGAGKGAGGAMGGAGGHAGGGAGGHAGTGGAAGSGGATDGGASDATKGPGLGHSCSSGTDCGSGFCVQGVCCSSACADSCYACTNALTGSSPDGTCAVVSQGLADPAGVCSPGASSSCGTTGHCDGKGACEKFGSSTVCLAASCSGGGFTSSSTCDGKGSCAPGTATDCKGFSCSATKGCATKCSADADCPGGYCTSTMTCAVTTSDGSTCSKNSQCTHANCISGICCAITCTGTCMTCATGLCKPVASGGSSAGACAADSTACGHDGTCDGNGGCRFSPSSVSCGAVSCSGGQLTPTGLCNGAGACSTPAAAACSGGVVCASTTTCKPSTCTADADCVGGLCQSGACVAKRPNGQTCTATDQCTSGFCASGVCCSSACTGTCQACTNKLTGSSPDGTCAAVSQGVADPAGGCAAGTAASCGNTGHCDGKGACEKLGSSTVCLAASCGSAGYTSPSTCDGKGNCTAGTTTGCKGFSCSPTTGCATSCSADGDCPGGYCTSTMTCAATTSDGSTCSKNSQCTHANCVSGVCCATTCAGTCMTCGTGLCKPVVAGGSSAGACAVDSTACGHDGTCDGNGGCRYAISSVSCGSPSCSSAKLTAMGNCNGSGTCSPGGSAACANNLICASTTACKTTCSADTDCVSTAYCSSGSCVVKKSNGSTCGAAHECGSAICAPDGICCNRACTNSCEACDNAGSVGTCSPVQSGPVHGNRTACSGGGTTCAGSCMGLASGLCSYPTVSCGTASCSGTQIVTAGTCNGNGSCSVPAAQNCSGGYICSGGACQTTCSTSAGCLSDSFCYANACHTDVVNISTGADHSCAALKDGRVYCWGESTFGGLGNGSTTDTIVLNPVRAGTFNDAVAVSMGSYSSYALTSSGTIRAWGRGQSYELGNGVSMDQPNPVTVATSSATLTGVTHVVGGNSYGCATTASGIYCWGANDSHGLGVDAVTTATALAIPYASPVMGESSSPAFFGGGGFHVAVNGGTVCPWGGDNGYKEITASSACNVACYSAPSNCFSVGGTVDMLAAGGSFACVKYGPNIQCWGENDQGAIGGPTSTISVAPPGNFISGLSPTPIDMQSFGTGVCALLNDGVPTLKCWGYPFSDNASSSSPPVTFSLTFPSGVKAKSLGAGDTATACLITDEGSPWCWGANTYGNVGNGTQGNMVPNPVEVLVNW